MNRRTFQQLEVLLSWLPLPFLMLWCAQVLVGMVTVNPYGSYMISFVPCYASGAWTIGRSIRGFTLLSASANYVVVYYLTSYLRPILRTACSGLVSFIGLIHYEFWWHVGLEISKNTWPGETFYWGGFTICLLMFLYFVDIYANILDLSLDRIFVLICLYCFFILLWIGILGSGFYQKFSLFVAEKAVDPCNLWIAMDKVIGVVMWATIIRSGEKR